MNELAREKYRRTSELMGVELSALLDRRPGTLSGGEKQRVALGRCITRDPAVFLLDEPFSSLDQALRERYRVNLKVLLRQFGITTVYVTHDHVEALILADRLAIMGRGRIEQIGAYQEIYDEPRNAFVAGFLNRHVGAPPISFLDGDHLPDPSLRSSQVGVRPEDVDISREPRMDGVAATVAGTLTMPMLNATIVSARVREREVYAQLPGSPTVRTGDAIWLTFRRYHVFEPDSGANLVETTNRFRVRGVLPMSGPSLDPSLMPEFPGIAKAESTHDWDAGFPLVHQIRDQDDKYWKDYRGTPKGFVTLSAGQKMWGSRFGNVTGIRWTIPSAASPEAIAESVLQGRGEQAAQRVVQHLEWGKKFLVSSK